MSQVPTKAKVKVLDINDEGLLFICVSDIKYLNKSLPETFTFEDYDNLLAGEVTNDDEYFIVLDKEDDKYYTHCKEEVQFFEVEN